MRAIGTSIICFYLQISLYLSDVTMVAMEKAQLEKGPEGPGRYRGKDNHPVVLHLGLCVAFGLGRQTITNGSRGETREGGLTDAYMHGK
ncbi:MAG: hypothetical protein CM15mP83_8260 [Flavobacteriaceae bacterium]|nr:MAG: hypothetical protein CM15mP83_8260 [Flavobacteriaceae bacterium]